MITEITEETFEDITGLTLLTPSFINLLPIQKDDDGKYLLNIFRTYTINDEVKSDLLYYYVYTAHEEDWWENVSYDFYDNTELWWINCLLNDITNPFEEMEPGLSMKVLKEDYVPQIVREIRLRAGEHVRY